ncbi:hypothetical protein [Adhaeribacter terreus]|uniref:RAMA domain-containing protein n=1 Tax=Adhaeribacter terreus TaxID=529703 RepID=A0ABW0EFI8_9BACT
MNRWSNYIAQVESAVQELSKELAPYLNAANKKEKQAQLNSIDQSIYQMEKGHINIPDELRQLKLKLLKDLDQFKEAEAAQQKVLELLQPLLAIAPQTRKQTQFGEAPKKVSNKVSGSRIDLTDLLTAGYLKPGMQLIKKYKGETYKGTITEEGFILTNISGQELSFPTPTAAAEAITLKAQNGWVWWSVEGDPKDRTIDYYRQQYKVKTGQ